LGLLLREVLECLAGFQFQLTTLLLRVAVAVLSQVAAALAGIEKRQVFQCRGVLPLLSR
jgi:hypothetical protein